MKICISGLLSAQLLFVSASATMAAPIVTEYNGFSVRIQGGSFSERERSPITDAEAQRVCTLGGKGSAEYASTKELADYVLEHLYLCLN